MIRLDQAVEFQSTNALPCLLGVGLFADHFDSRQAQLLVVSQSTQEASGGHFC